MCVLLPLGDTAFWFIFKVDRDVWYIYILYIQRRGFDHNYKKVKEIGDGRDTGFPDVHTGILIYWETQQTLIFRPKGLIL